MKQLAMLLLLLLSTGLATADSFIDELVEVTFGEPRSQAFEDESKVYGPPRGTTDGHSGSLDVLNIGVGGRITVRFRDPVIYNGPGPDFTVFENNFAILDATSGEASGNVFLEPAFVSVSSDGFFFVQFPTDYISPSSPVLEDSSPSHYIGFAGIQPVYSHPANGIDPLDPLVSGGDVFDLDSLGGVQGADLLDMENIRFIRIRDTGLSAFDSEGDPLPAPLLTATNGFDLDAIAVVNGKPDTGTSSVDTGQWERYR
jgi:hypothetical protein